MCGKYQIRADEWDLWCIHTGLVRNRNQDRDWDKYYAEPFTLHGDWEEWVVVYGFNKNLSHCTWTGTEKNISIHHRAHFQNLKNGYQIHSSGPENVPGVLPCPCSGGVWKVHIKTIQPILPGPCPCPCSGSGPSQCEYTIRPEEPTWFMCDTPFTKQSRIQINKRARNVPGKYNDFFDPAWICVVRTRGNVREEILDSWWMLGVKQRWAEWWFSTWWKQQIDLWKMSPNSERLTSCYC